MSRSANLSNLTNEQRPLPFLNDGIVQIALIVPDLEGTVKRYYELFGIGDWHFYTYGKSVVPKMYRFGEPTDCTVRVALSYLGPMRIELIEVQNPEEPSVYSEFLREHGYGLHHVGVLTTNMDESVAAAAQSGISVVQEGSGFGLDGDGHYAYLDTQERLGMVVELIERPKHRHPPQKIYPYSGR